MDWFSHILIICEIIPETFYRICQLMERDIEGNCDISPKFTPEKFALF